MLFKYKDISIESTMGSPSEPMFLASDVAIALGLHVPTISRFLKSNLRAKDFRTIKNGSKRPPFYVNESGLYKLVSIAGTEDAFDFQYWIFDEVLPAIRRDGVYISPDISPEQVDRLEARVADLKKLLENTPRNPHGATPGDRELDNLAVDCLEYSIGRGFDPSSVARSVKRRVNQLCCIEFPKISEHLSNFDQPVRSAKGHRSTALEA